MSPDDLTIDGEEILALLRDLGERLAFAGVHADIYIIGGAAIALTLDTRRVTRDIDAALKPNLEVRDVALEMAREKGLPEGWLDSAAMGFAPDAPDLGAVLIDLPGLSIAVASPEHLLAMKMAAARPGRDMEDLELLFRTLGLTEPGQAVDIARRLYGEESVVLSDPPESYLFLSEEILARIASRG